MKKILAVSGGVDSMVMLDLMLERFPAEELVVATFDHGTRESSKLDADFVAKEVAKNAQIAPALQLQFYRGEAALGAEISEEKAREKRYEFLRKVAFEEKGEIYTAHHLDDLVETVAINLIRGTGWRGLTVLDSTGVRRPFIDGTFGEVFDKRKILEYAVSRGVVFRQDPTNTSEKYLRNRVREKMRDLPWSMKMKIYELWQRQVEIKREIDEILEAILPEDLKFERTWFGEMDEKVAMEILRAGLLRAGVTATRPQIREFYQAILAYESGKKFNLPNDKLVRIGRRDFQLRV
mgnify:CR=1 FL=1